MYPTYDECTGATCQQKTIGILKAAPVDSNFAGDTASHCKPVSGIIIIKLTGGAVLNKMLQYLPTAAGLPTEARFMVDTEGGKCILHLRTVLQEIDLLKKEQATVFFLDDTQDALPMANAQ